MMKRLFLIFLLVFCLAGNALCFPALTGRVVDEAHILTPQQKQNLEQLLKTAEPHQVVAVSLSSLEGKAIEEYGYQLGRHWGIGRKGVNDGVLILIVPEQRLLRIEVGYGLEGVLTDAVCSQIQNRIMIPLAKQGKYAQSLIDGSKAVVDTIKGEKISLSHNAGSFLSDKMLVPLLALAVILMIVRALILLGPSYKKNSKKNRFLFWFENVFMINFIYCLGFSLLFSSYYVFLIGVLAIATNYSNWKRYRANPQFPYKVMLTHRRSLFGGSSSSGSSFSGGGGSFGGGGSSGRW